MDDVEVIVLSKKLMAVKEEHDAFLFLIHSLYNYCSEVETALKLGRLSNVTRQSFIARIALLMPIAEGPLDPLQ